MVEIEEWKRRPAIGAHEIAGGRFVITKDGRIGTMKNSMLIRGNGGAAVQVMFSGKPSEIINLSELRVALEYEIHDLTNDVRDGLYEHAVDAVKYELKGRDVAESTDTTHVIVTTEGLDGREHIAAFDMRYVPDRGTPEGRTLTIARKVDRPNGIKETVCVTYQIKSVHHIMTQNYNGEWSEAVNLEVKSLEGSEYMSQNRNFMKGYEV